MTSFFLALPLTQQRSYVYTLIMMNTQTVETPELKLFDGLELDRREYPSNRVAVMSDGNIMRNTGQGWKLWKKLKPGVDPADYAQRMRAQSDARPAMFHEYVKALMDAVAIELRGRLHNAVSLMPNDPDGVWSEFDLWNGPQVDLDDCIKLCALYERAAATTQEVTQ